MYHVDYVSVENRHIGVISAELFFAVAMVALAPGEMEWKSCIQKEGFFEMVESAL